MFEMPTYEPPTDVAGTCDAVAAAHAELLEVEAKQLQLAAHWLDLHAPVEHPDAEVATTVLPGRERFVSAGADGTPLVSEFACAEFAVLQDMHPQAGAAHLRKVANLRHRHPVLWQRVLNREVRAWKALEVARLVGRVELGLDVEQARWIDERTAPWISTLPWASFLRLLEKLVIAADPRGAEERRAQAEAAHFVATSQTNEYGAKTLVARAAAGEVIYLVAVVDRIAEILAARGDTREIGPRRASALALLAHPAHALKLLAEGTAMQPLPGEPGEDEPGEDEPCEEQPGDVERDQPHPAEASEEAGRQPARQLDRSSTQKGGSFSADVLPSYLRRDPTLASVFAAADLDRLLPDATLYVHLTRADLLETAGRVGPGAAEVEGVGVVTTQQAREWLGHRRVRVVPVLDPEAEPPADSYAFPPRIREALQLLRPRDVFPFAANAGRRKDIDHAVPYRSPDHGGPPGQTGLHNAAPMVRFHHRLKTHADWRLRQVAVGTFLWRSPHGHYWLVDRTGTHRLPKPAGEWIAKHADALLGERRRAA